MRVCGAFGLGSAPVGNPRVCCKRRIGSLVNMRLEPVPSEVARAGLAVLRDLCLEASGPGLSDLQRRFLAGVQTSILHSAFDIDSLPSVTPAELAAIVDREDLRGRIVRAGVIASCIDGTVSGAALERLEAYGEALQTDTHAISTAWHMANERLILARFDIVRRSLPGVKIRGVVGESGVLAALKQFFPLAGIEIPALTERARAMASLPDGTLGRGLMDYFATNGFPLPGEKGAGPEIILVHDCIHVLGRFGTSPSEEIEVAAFQAGCVTDDPIYGMLFGLAQYHLNIQVAPVAASQAGHADPERMLAAFARGCRVKVNMGTQFDPWAYVARPVDEVRETLGF